MFHDQLEILRKQIETLTVIFEQTNPCPQPGTVHVEGYTPAFKEKAPKLYPEHPDIQ